MYLKILCHFAVQSDRFSSKKNCPQPIVSFLVFPTKSELEVLTPCKLHDIELTQGYMAYIHFFSLQTTVLGPNI